MTNLNEDSDFEAKKSKFLAAFGENYVDDPEDNSEIKSLIDEYFGEYDPTKPSSYVWDFELNNPQMITAFPRHYFETTGCCSDRTMCPVLPTEEDFQNKKCDIFFFEEMESTFSWDGNKKFSDKKIARFLNFLGLKRIDMMGGFGGEALTTKSIKNKIGAWLYDFKENDELQYCDWKRTSKKEFHNFDLKTKSGIFPCVNVVVRTFVTNQNNEQYIITVASDGDDEVVSCWNLEKNGCVLAHGQFTYEHNNK